MNSTQTFDASEVKALIQIRLGEDTLELQIKGAQGVESVLMPALGLARLERHYFSDRLLNPMDAERAIAGIEDELMPLASRLPSGSELHADDETIRELARWAGTSNANSIQVLTSEALELVFNRWVALIEGRPSSQDGLPTSGKFSAALVLLREWMHHMGFDRLTLSHSTPHWIQPYTLPWARRSNPCATRVCSS